MKLHFAYGSNMSRSHMAVRCPQALALGTAVLAGWRFVVEELAAAGLEAHGAEPADAAATRTRAANMRRAIVKDGIERLLERRRRQ